MTAESRPRAQEVAELLHKKEDVANCAHIERREAEHGVMSMEDSEVGRGNSGQMELKLVRKLDWVILPILWIMYWFK